MQFEWDVGKAEANNKKHRVRFSESLPLFEDDDAITVTDNESDPGEVRFVSIGTGAKGRVLVVTYTHVERISALFQRALQSRMRAHSTRKTDEATIRFQQRQTGPHRPS
jgi:uncharacterized protein